MGVHFWGDCDRSGDCAGGERLPAERHGLPRFYNLPELMQMFREVADIQTADMLNLPVPEAEYRVVKVKPTELQEEMVEELGNRAGEGAEQ